MGVSSRDRAGLPKCSQCNGVGGSGAHVSEGSPWGRVGVAPEWEPALGRRYHAHKVCVSPLTKAALGRWNRPVPTTTEPGTQASKTGLPVLAPTIRRQLGPRELLSPGPKKPGGFSLRLLGQCKHLSALILGLTGKCGDFSFSGGRKEHCAVRAISGTVVPPEHLPLGVSLTRCRSSREKPRVCWGPKPDNRSRGKHLTLASLTDAVLLGQREQACSVCSLGQQRAGQLRAEWQSSEVASLWSQLTSRGQMTMTADAGMEHLPKTQHRADL